jgi:hypothetical protein
MPPKRIQNSIATGRQKSCTQCVKSKRRCDLQQPSCLRCTRQHLACSYPSRPPVQGFPSAAIDSAVPVTSPCQTGLSLDTTTYHSRQGIGLLDLDLNAGIGSLGFVHDILNTPTCGNQELSLPLTRSISVPINKQCLSQIVPETYERISYSIEQLKQGPATMVLEKQTPWSHPRLYEDHMPRILQGPKPTSIISVFMDLTCYQTLMQPVRCILRATIQTLRSSPAISQTACKISSRALLRLRRWSCSLERMR